MLKKTGISYGFEKVQTCNGKTEITLSMAKNEAESCVISFCSDEDLKNLYLDIEGAEDFSVETEEEIFFTCNSVQWPDAIVPIKSFDIKKAELKNILVRFTPRKSITAGVHKINVSLKNGEETISSYTVNIRVWKFSLPEEYTVRTSMNIHSESIYRLHNAQTNEEKRAIYIKYYEYLLKFRVSPFTLPYEILEDEANKYLSDPRVTSFLVDDDTNSEDDETLIKIYQKLSSNPEWLKKAMVYPLDEATTKEQIDILKGACRRLEKLCPGIKRTSPFFKDIKYSEEKDEVQCNIDNCQIVLPKLTCFDDEFIYEDPELKEKYGSFKDRMEEAQKNGKEIWQYVCWEPGKPYVNLYVDEAGLDHRILFWQQHLVGATGFLYWCTTYWPLIDSPWNTMATVPDLSENVFGDGSLLYNGNHVGIDGPCGSVRLECVRDGIEDCEMLLMADKYLGREWVLNKVKQITADLKNYTDSPSLFVKVREEIGSELERVLNGK